MRFTLPLLASLLLAAGAMQGCASVAQTSTRAGAVPRAEVVRHGAAFDLTYDLGRDSAVWAFTDSALGTEDRKPWRPTQWQVLTPNVVLDRAGHYDILRTQDGSPVPRVVQIRITPRAIDLEAAYPTVTFSNGAIALPTHQMNLFAQASVQAVRDLSSDLNGVELQTGPAQVRWRDEAGPVLYAGVRRPQLITQFERSYVLFGAADVARDDGLTAVIDPALPDWLARTLEQAAPATGRWYRQRLGAASATNEQPVLMAAWNAPQSAQTSMSGSVLPGLIVMNFEGRGISQPDDEIRERALLFIAHEAAHFWLGQTVGYEYAREAWITEGGADLMAVRALQAMRPNYDPKPELQREIDDCVRFAGQPLAAAGERGEHRAYYACGAVFAMAAEAAQRRQTGGDYLDYVREMMRRNPDGVVGVDQWMAQFLATGGKPEIAQQMQILLTRGSADPASTVQAILSDLDVTRADGRVVLR